MFSVTGVEAAANHIFNMMDPEKVREVRQKYAIEFSIFSYEDLTNAFNKSACIKKEYSLPSDDPMRVFEYGQPLFSQKAVNILVKEEDRIITDRVYVGFDKELWLTEDLTFYIVNSVYLRPNNVGKSYMLERWEVEKAIQDQNDLFFEPEIFFCELFFNAYLIYPDREDPSSSDIGDQTST